MSDKLKTYPSQPRAFHKEPFATHPWISWWLGCMRVLAARLSPLHFLRPGWLKGNVNSALFPKGMLLTPNHPPGWTRHAPSSLKEKCLLTMGVLRTYPTHSLSFHTELCDHLYFRSLWPTSLKNCYTHNPQLRTCRAMGSYRAIQ